jgi:F-type H+-transporting ATPase subunit a
MHHEFWIVTTFNKIFGPAVAAALAPLGYHLDPAHAVPDYLVMTLLIVLGLTALCLLVKSQLSVENPGRLQILLEDAVSFVLGILREYIGPKGDKYLPLIASIGLFIFTANAIGKIPGLMSPTANLNTTLGCAITVWVFYHVQGFREQGVINYLVHFAVMPGAPLWMAPLILIIELISHASRVMSLALRLFGNIFGEEMVVAVIASIVQLIAPLPFMVLGIITGSLQAFIFMLLTVIYLAAAVHTEHEHEAHVHEAGAHAAA